MSDLLDETRGTDDDLAQLIETSRPDLVIDLALEESQSDVDEFFCEVSGTSSSVLALLEESEPIVGSEWLADARDEPLCAPLLEDAADNDPLINEFTDD